MFFSGCNTNHTFLLTVLLLIEDDDNNNNNLWHNNKYSIMHDHILMKILCSIDMFIP